MATANKHSSFSVNVNGREMSGEEIVAAIKKRTAGQQMPWWLKLLVPDRDGNGMPDVLDQLEMKLPEFEARAKQLQDQQHKTVSVSQSPVQQTGIQSPSTRSTSSILTSSSAQSMSFNRPKQTIENPITSGNRLADMPALKAVLMLGSLVALGFYLYSMGIFS